LPSPSPPLWGGVWGEIGGVWGEVGRVWREVGKVWGEVGEVWGEVGRVWGKVGGVWGEVGGVWKGVGRLAFDNSRIKQLLSAKISTTLSLKNIFSQFTSRKKTIHNFLSISFL
jgi:hypothetical protein